ncbi:hypothetical protein FE840_017065 [Peteryoungia desertarenae]|uniref:Uncharacterized protein n=1 Tax=Peteryoungia desertarenae TaxID=1813451 RepID=A0ABX6QTC5_9HYPH|nr:hypothetical protein [Peteryoungia desertarenae]QLF71455.1 hypothetical protein FE840_017065 [Peteryoungia desertarenae]
MTQFDEHEEEEKPLDPVMEGVRRKMVKLQLISGSIMFLMFLAVLGSIFYKLTQDAETTETVTSGGLSVPADQPITATAQLPTGFRILSTALSGNQLLIDGVTVEGVRKALVFDIAVGRIVADITLGGN